MSIMKKLLWMLGIRTIKIMLIGHEREGGYIYITSPDLPGFTFMLEPGEEKNIRTFIDAIHDPLTAYVEAHFKATSSADNIELTGYRQSKPMNYVAEFCHA